MPDAAAIILAAGASARLGRPKQLLSFRGKTLLQHVTDEALAAGLHPVVVVAGAHAEKISADGAGVQVVYNEQWAEGMGTGIKAGMAALMQLQNKPGAVLLAVCDQPFVSARLFEQILATQQHTAKGIVACAYGGTVGTPVLFTQTYFDQLSAMKGSGGAKKLVLQHAADLAELPFAEGAIDIDTEADYEHLLRKE